MAHSNATDDSETKMMFDQFKGPNMIERAHYLITSNYGTPENKKQWATKALQYLSEINYIMSPHLNAFLKASGYAEVPETVSIQDIPNDQMILLQKIISHEFDEALYSLESKKVPRNEYYRNLEMIMQLLIRAKNYKGAEELEYRMDNIYVNQIHETLKEELDAYQRIQLLSCACLFFEEQYFSCCSNFFKFLENDDGIIDLLKHDSLDPFILNEEFLLMIVISVLVSVPLDNYADFIYLEHLKAFFEVCPLLIECLQLLIDTKFGKFFEIWHEVVGSKYQESPFLNKGWVAAKLMMRSKIYFFYLRISNYIHISYLSKTLGIDINAVREELSLLIESAHLNFKIDGDLVVYKVKHYLEDPVQKLRENQVLIDKELEHRKSQNSELQNIIHHSIVTNEEKFPSSRELSSKLLEDDHMDINDVNTLSDAESLSFEYEVD
ncbi:Pci8p NDAI_0A02400 [Naumovozyma dairenensis CBS 421]|uniref:PCI domain-containing protein n=1 Tax=Naumovozyma dairenensis (strain ATCC 10597 / BCRC 20456 / CBS 421 / NBRC 0211 / NRRL Y-12639) TaxID=1071378 RepID=G0W3L0_NAUDC|nr:hypothetical protein NDAI_0A02400 [Naumovozyma dairenensis CBS 421]CCD22398.1 hypothetical protein NDAI_0A02400 [Naumovozyma dairenensis CBS 421]